MCQHNNLPPAFTCFGYLHKKQAVITGRNEVVAKIIFLQVCVSTRGCLPQCMLGYPPGSRHPPGSRPPRADTRPGRDTPSPGLSTPLGLSTPPRLSTPPETKYTTPWEADSGIRSSTSGRYASYWNAFLFCLYVWICFSFIHSIVFRKLTLIRQHYVRAVAFYYWNWVSMNSAVNLQTYIYK